MEKKKKYEEEKLDAGGVSGTECVCINVTSGILIQRLVLISNELDSSVHISTTLIHKKVKQKKKV